MANKGEMLEKKGMMLANGEAKVKIEPDFLRDCIESEDPSEQESRENDPLQHIMGTEIDPLVKTESKVEDPFRHTERTNNDPQLQIENNERDPWMKIESGEEDPQMDTESGENYPQMDTEGTEKDPLVKAGEETDPLVNNPNVSDNSVRCEATTKYPSASKAVSRWMIQAMVLDYEKNGRHVLESDGVATYIEESKGDSIVEEDDIRNCPSGEIDVCYPNFKDNTRNDPRTESDTSYSILKESRDEGGSESNASPPNLKEAESKLGNSRPTRQGIHLRNKPIKNSDKLTKNSSSHLRNKVGKQTATDTALKFTCRKCTSSFPTKIDLTEHVQLHVQLDTRKNMNYSEIFVKERNKYFRSRKEQLKTKTLEAEQECSSRHPSEKRDLSSEQDKNTLIKDTNIPHKNKLAEILTVTPRERRIKDGTHPTFKRHKKLDYLVEIVCRDCGESFKQGDLEKHSAVCAALKKYECAKCDLKFKFKSSYEKHIEIHKYSVNTYIAAQDQVMRSSDHSSTIDQVKRSSNHGSTKVQRSSNCISVVDQLQGPNSHSSIVDQVHRSGNHSSIVDQVQRSGNHSSIVDQGKRASNTSSVVELVQRSSNIDLEQGSNNHSSAVHKETLGCKSLNEKKTEKEAQYNRVTIIKPKGTMRGMYQCTTCKRELFGLAKVLSHTSVHSGNEWYTHLENTNEVGNEWYTHLEKTNTVFSLANSFHCLLCTKYFAKTYYETVHYHFECLTCNVHFMEKADVNTHQESHNADIAYLVTQVVLPWAPIKRPEVRSLAPPRFECQECHQVFDQRPLLASHSVTAHPSKFRWIEENKTKNVMFKCVECNLNVLCQAAYFGHLLAHSGPK